MTTSGTPSELLAKIIADSPAEQLRRMNAQAVLPNFVRDFIDGQWWLDAVTKDGSPAALLHGSHRPEPDTWLHELLGRIDASEPAWERIKALVTPEAARPMLADELTAEARYQFHKPFVDALDAAPHRAPILEDLNAPRVLRESPPPAEEASPVDLAPLKEAVATAVHEALAKEGIKSQQMPDWVKTAIVNIIIALITAIIGPLIVHHKDSAAATLAAAQAAHGVATAASNLYIVASSGTYLTSGPHTAQRHVALSHKGDLVRVLKRQDGWAYIELRSQDPAIVRRGWIKTRNLRPLDKIAAHIVHTTIIGDDFDAD